MFKEYIQDCWRELWNPDSRVWQYIDRIAFILLPLISFILAIISKGSDESENWRVVMANLAWIIPLLIWLLVLLIVVPYRVVNKHKLQRTEARTECDKLIQEKDWLNQEHVIQLKDMERKLTEPLLQQNQKEHSKQIRTLLESWLGSLSVPKISEVERGTTSLMDMVKRDIRFDYLKEHLPSTKLWQHYTNWDSKMTEYLDKCKKLRTEIQAVWKIDGTQATNSFANPILKMIDGEELRLIMAYGEEPLEEVSGQMLSVNGIDVVLGNSFEGLGCSACPHSTLGLEYQKVADKFLRQPLVAELKQLSSDLLSLSTDIHELLRQFLESADYNKHSCKDCPIQLLTLDKENSQP